MKFYSRRAYTGGANQPAVVGQNPYVGVVNGGTGAYILRIRWWNALVPSGNNLLMGFVALSQLTGVVNNIATPMWNDQAAAVGIPFRAQQSSNLFPTSFMSVQGAANSLATELPIAYLQPGAAFVFVASSNNVSLSAVFLWEELFPSMLETHELE